MNSGRVRGQHRWHSFGSDSGRQSLASCLRPAGGPRWVLEWQRSSYTPVRSYRKCAMPGDLSTATWQYLWHERPMCDRFCSHCANRGAGARWRQPVHGRFLQCGICHVGHHHDYCARQQAQRIAQRRRRIGILRVEQVGGSPRARWRGRSASRQPGEIASLRRLPPKIEGTSI